MTEQEVLEKLNIFKNALIKKNDEIKELNAQIESLNKSYNEKQTQLEVLSISLQDKDSIKSDLENKIKQLEQQIKDDTEKANATYNRSIEENK